MSSMTQQAPVLRRVQFGEYLIERRAITDGQLLDALADHWARGGRIGDVLVKKGVVGRDLVERLADEYQHLHTVYV